MPVTFHNGRVDEMQTALQDVLHRVPGSIRRLAASSGLSHTTLRQARDGDFRLSLASVQAIVMALRDWGDTCIELADKLEAAHQTQVSTEGEADGG